VRLTRRTGSSAAPSQDRRLPRHARTPPLIRSSRWESLDPMETEKPSAGEQAPNGGALHWWLTQNSQICASPPLRPVRRVAAQIGGYACATSARGGSGASRAQRTAGDVRAPASCHAGGLWPSSEGPSDLFRRGWPSQLFYGGSTRFYGGSTRRQGSSGPVRGGCGCGAGTGGQQREAATVLPDDEASCCGCRGPALPAARSRLTALAVSAGHMPGPAGRAGAAASFRLRNAGRRALAVLAWSGDGSPVRGCTTTGGVQVRTR
jgi:hypothetical protein